MSGKTAGGLVLIVVGVAAAIWGVNYMNSFGSQLASELGARDNTGPLAVGAGVVIALIGLVLAVSKSKQRVSQASVPSSSENKFCSRCGARNAAADSFCNECGAKTAVMSGDHSVLLNSYGSNKINVIKVVREITELDLKEAKDLVDNLPKEIKSGLNLEQAEEIKARLTAVGATVTIG